MTTISIPYFDFDGGSQREPVQTTGPSPLPSIPAMTGQPNTVPSAKASTNINVPWQSASLSTPTAATSLHETAATACSTGEQAINKLTKAILGRFPLASPAIVLFTGSEGNPHSQSTCNAVAKSLAQRNIGNILLVDSSAGCELSLSHDLKGHRGLSNLLGHSFDWHSAVVNLPQGNLSFLCAGTTHWEHMGAEQRLRELSAELKREYQFIFVSVGDAQHSNAKMWSSVCDGSYLLVSLKNANPMITESAVAELQSSGARLLGCIVTESDATL